MLARLVLEQFTADVADKMASLPATPVFGAPAADFQRYHKTWGALLDSMERLMDLSEYHRVALFWYAIVLTLQTFKVLRGQPKLAQLANSLRHALEDVLHFVIVFLVLFLNFAFSGFMIFGLALGEWSTPAKAINTSFRSLLGDTDLAAMYEIAPISAIVWFWLFTTVMIFLMLNLLLAIVFDHYSIVKAKCGQSTGVLAQLRSVLWDQRYRGCRCCCCRRASVPPHERLLEQLAKCAGLPPEELRGVRGSVLGAKWHRKERERFAFAEGVALGGEAMEAARAPVARDLKALGVDPDYAEALLEGCGAHSKRECDHEELKVLQLRGLVNIAEADIAGMRERLGTCQAGTKGTMLGLSRRLEALERMVHASLHDLVMIAGAAGVPDAKPSHSPAQKARLDSTVGSLRSLDAATKSDGMLRGSMGKVLRKLGQPGLEKVKSDVQDWHRAMKTIDTRGRLARPDSSANA